MSRSVQGRIVIAANVAVIVIVPLSTLVVPKGATVVVIASRWSAAADPLRIVANAGGAFVAIDRFPWIAVALSDADFTSHLFRNGAWLVLDPALAAGCLRSTRR